MMSVTSACQILVEEEEEDEDDKIPWAYGYKNLQAASKRIGGHSNSFHGISSSNGSWDMLISYPIYF